MKISAQLTKINLEMTSEELAEALNNNFEELKTASEQRDQVILNSLGRLEKEVGALKSDVGTLKADVNRIIDHLSGKKLLTG